MEELLTIIFGRIIVGFFGKYTLLAFYKLVNNKKGIEWLTQPNDEMEAFSGGCLINIVGIVSFGSLIALIVYLFF